MVYKEITVDVWRKPNEEVRVIQEEAEGRALVVHVFDSAAPLDLSQKSVFVYIQKPDDKLIYAQAQVSGNTASIALTGQMMSAYGRTKLFELEVVGNRGQVLKITLPVLYIVKSAYHDAIESTNEFSVLTENLQKVQSAVQKRNQRCRLQKMLMSLSNKLQEKRRSLSGTLPLQRPRGWRQKICGVRMKN